MSAATATHPDGGSVTEPAAGWRSSRAPPSRRGIGRATAMQLAKRGFHVAVLDLEQDAVDEAADTLCAGQAVAM